MAGALAASIAGGVVAMTGTAGAERALARAELRNGDAALIGTVTFLGHGTHADRVRVELSMPSTATGLGDYHGFHIHAVGMCTAPGFGSAGGHWNLVANAEHGRHTGDMPSLLVGLDGTASAEFDTHRFNVAQLFDNDGAAVIVHTGVDNFGNVPLTSGKYQDPADWYHNAVGTANTGDAGTRYACGVVERA